MITSNRISIIVDDGAVYLDTYTYLSLDFTDCDIPEDIHALQWLDNKGHIEYRGQFVSNEDIHELPMWAIKCIAKWEEAYQISPPPG